MVDITVTPANVTWVSGKAPFKGQGGAQIDPGELCYLDPADNEYKLADGDAVATLTNPALALSSGENGRPMILAGKGARVNFGATLTAGTIYVASLTAGGIAPDTDLSTGDFVLIVAIGEGTAVATLILEQSAVAHA